MKRYRKPGPDPFVGAPAPAPVRPAAVGDRLDEELLLRPASGVAHVGDRKPRLGAICEVEGVRGARDEHLGTLRAG